MISDFHFRDKEDGIFEIMIKFFYKTTIKLQFVHPLEPCVLKIKELFDKNLCQICISCLNFFNAKSSFQYKINIESINPEIIKITNFTILCPFLSRDHSFFTRRIVCSRR